MANLSESLLTQGKLVNRETILGQVGEDVSIAQTLSNAFILTRRELRDTLRDWRIAAPLVILTLFFPLLASITSTVFIDFFDRYGADGDNLVEAFLPLIPMIVGFFPSSISLPLALESFVGEKERRSLEPLLSTPLTNLELYIGKVIAASVPPLIAAYLGLGVYLTAVTLGPQGWRPDIDVIAQVLVLTTAQAILMVTGAVIISSHTTSTRAANLLASVIILPMSFLVIAESTIIIRPSERSILWVAAVVDVIVTVALIRIGIQVFNREEMLGRAVDNLNLSWIGRILWHQFLGLDSNELAKLREENVKPNPIRWYRRTVFKTVTDMRKTWRFVALIMLVGVVLGFAYVQLLDLPLNDINADNTSIQVQVEEYNVRSDSNLATVPKIVDQNARMLLGIMLISVFTFGILALVVGAVPFFMLGALLGIMVSGGVGPLLLLIRLGPHDIPEIAAILIATTASFRAGSIIMYPPSDSTVGEAWLRACSDALKVFVGLVIPLLVLSAIIEIAVTPPVIDWIFGTI